MTESQNPMLVEIPNAEIFRAGDYGDKGAYTAEDLKAYAENYNAGKHEAPVTVDHAQKGPAFGWLKPGSVKALGEKLVGTLQVIPEFADTIRRGMFKKRSIELYREPKNIRAVTFLGAQPPEVKGMPDLAFSASTGAVHIDFQESQPMTDQEKKDLLAAIGAMIDEKIKAAMAGEDKPEAEADPNAPAVDPNAPPAADMACKDKKLMSELEGRISAERKAREAEAAKHAKDLKDRDDRIAKIEAARFAESRDNRWKSAADELGITAGAREAFAALALFDEQDTKTVAFGEKKDATLLDVLRGLISNLPLAEFGEEVTAGVGSKTVNRNDHETWKAAVAKLQKEEGFSTFAEASEAYDRRNTAKKGN